MYSQTRFSESTGNTPLQAEGSDNQDPDTPTPEDQSDEESNTHLGKPEMSYAFFAELFTCAVETIDLPKFFCDIKKMPTEDQSDWILACDDDVKSLADRKIWTLVDLP